MPGRTPPPASASPALDAPAISRALRRIAHEIAERNPHPAKIALIGIPSRGVPLAKRLADCIEEFEKVRPETGVIDVSMHRDDLRLREKIPAVELSRLPLDLEQTTLILVDDVIFSGRTCRAALDAISSFGRPLRVQLAVLVDRGHRELPIRADYVGKNLPTSPAERVEVRIAEIDGAPEGVWVTTP